MTYHHTERAAHDIRARLDSLQHRLRHPLDNHADICAELSATIAVIRRGSWFLLHQDDHRKLVDRVTALADDAIKADTDDEIATAVTAFVGALRAVVDPFD